MHWEITVLFLGGRDMAGLPSAFAMMSMYWFQHDKIQSTLHYKKKQTKVVVVVGCYPCQVTLGRSLFPQSSGLYIYRKTGLNKIASSPSFALETALKTHPRKERQWLWSASPGGLCALRGSPPDGLKPQVLIPPLCSKVTFLSALVPSLWACPDSGQLSGSTRPRTVLFSLSFLNYMIIFVCEIWTQK